MPRSVSAELFARAQRLSVELGLAPLEEKSVGGASDGNFVAGLGVRTLDGLGPVGDGAHAEGEHIQITMMPERTALVAALVAELIGGSTDG
jgi:glutamate carboxypeptidase